MVSENNDVALIIKDPNVLDLIGKLQKKLNTKIFPIYTKAMAQAMQNRLYLARVSNSELLDLVIRNEDLFIRFSVASILDARKTPIEQEHSLLEPVDESIKVGKTLGMSRDFIIPNMIDFWFVAMNPEGLEAYLRATRIPNAKKVSLRLKEIFSRMR